MALSIQDRHILRDRVIPLVTRELMGRLRAKPTPPYDADIVEVLDFVRRNPDPQAPHYAIVRVLEDFAIVARRQPPGATPEFVDDVRYPDRDAAECAVIERRLRDYGVTW